MELEAVDLLMVECNAADDCLRFEKFLACVSHPRIGCDGFELAHPASNGALWNIGLGFSAHDALGFSKGEAEIED